MPTLLVPRDPASGAVGPKSPASLVPGCQGLSFPGRYCPWLGLTACFLLSSVQSRCPGMFHNWTIKAIPDSRLRSCPTRRPPEACPVLDGAARRASHSYAEGLGLVVGLSGLWDSLVLLISRGWLCCVALPGKSGGEQGSHREQDISSLFIFGQVSGCPGARDDQNGPRAAGRS